MPKAKVRVRSRVAPLPAFCETAFTQVDAAVDAVLHRQRHRVDAGAVAAVGRLREDGSDPRSQTLSLVGSPPSISGEAQVPVVA